MTRDVTSIQIQKSTWEQLKALKQQGDSFDDVIQRLLETDQAEARKHLDDELSSSSGFPVTCICGESLRTTKAVLRHLKECDRLSY